MALVLTEEKNREKYAYFFFIKLYIEPIFSKSIKTLNWFVSRVNISHNVTTVTKNLLL